MKARIIGAVAALLFPAAALAQNPKSATYITAEQVKMINGFCVDRQIVNVDVGNTNLAVGVVHRCRTGGRRLAVALRPVAEPRPRRPTPPNRAARRAHAGRVTHRNLAPGQTETYIIISGSGTLVTGGKVMNGRKSAPDSQGPRC